MRCGQSSSIVMTLALLVAACGGEDDGFSADDLEGTWQYTNGFVVRFGEDGRVVGASNEAQLDTGAAVDGVWSFDGSELTWTIDSSTIDDCVGASAVYELEPVDGDVDRVRAHW